MVSLEQVIKELEFENDTLVRSIKDEIETIDCIQSDMRMKTAENEKLEEVIEKLNSEAKSLHDHFKQNKDITESLKSATNLQQKYSEDLKTNLKLEIEESERQREEHVKRYDSYHSKWLSYEKIYEKHPIAQNIRKYKLESADLEAEEKRVEAEKFKLQSSINLFHKSKGLEKQNKREAINSILELAKLYVGQKSTEQKCVCLLAEEETLYNKIQSKQREYVKLTNQLDEKKKAMSTRQPSWVVEKSTSENKRLSNANHYPILKVASMKKVNMQAIHLSSKQFAVPVLNQPSMESALSNALENVKIKSKIQSNKDHFQLPQLPKMPSFSKLRKTYSLNVTKQVSGVDDITSVKCQPSQDHDISITVPLKEDVTYSAPLDQPVKEYLQEEHGIVVCEEMQSLKTTPSSSPSLRKYDSFSPGAHAEQLKLLKQSPGDFYQCQKRPMFNSTQTGESISTSSNNEFAQSFSDENNFNGFSTKDSLVTCNLTDAMNGENKIIDDSSNVTNNTVSNAAFVFVAPSSISSLTPVASTEESPAANTKKSAISNPDSLSSPCFSEDSSGFSFSNAVFSPEHANFNFTGSTDFSISSAKESSFTFDLANPSNQSTKSDSGFSLFGNHSDSPQSTTSIFNFNNDSSPVVRNSLSFNSSSNNVSGFNLENSPQSSDSFMLGFGTKDTPSPAATGNEFVFNFQ